MHFGYAILRVFKGRKRHFGILERESLEIPSHRLIQKNKYCKLSEIISTTSASTQRPISRLINF
ncbi:hypothetical protein CpecG_0083 [Chlamydia pecorum MC/MarsBar]|nr:hypothetical protein CpecG_0083 [Chlamydia pecorum MC/MarsBar]